MYSCDDEEFYEGDGYDSEQEEWLQFLNTIKAEALLQRQENLQDLWTHLRRDEPELLDTFEFFLDNAVREIDKIRGDKNVALKSKEQSEREVQQIFIDVEKILEEERDRIKAECEAKYRYELRRLSEAKQQELDDVIERKQRLERQLADINLHEKRSSESIRNLNKVIDELSCRENELKSENDDLQQENHRLHLQLSVSLDSLQRSQELCMKLHEEAESEKRVRVRELQDAVALKHEKIRKSDQLEIQLEQLKRKLMDEKNANAVQLPTPSKVSNDDRVKAEPEFGKSSASRPTPIHAFKIIMVGDSNVGKTSLIQRFCDDRFTGDRNPTVDITYQTKTVSTSDGSAVLQIWDTAGQERFRSIPKSYFRKADGIMMLYDVTNEESMSNVRHWISSMEATESNAGIMLLGNKMDSKPVVSEESGRKMAGEINAGFALVSAMTGENVEEAFNKLTRMLLAEQFTELSPPSGNIVAESIELEIQASAKSEKKNCCW